MSEYYKLWGREAIPATVHEWARSYEHKDMRRVGMYKDGDLMVSTVFLGLDHSFGSGPPMIFETLVRRGKGEDDMVRYSTWKQARAGHHAMVRKLKGEET